jgi:hypothetical protein
MKTEKVQKQILGGKFWSCMTITWSSSKMGKITWSTD